MDSKLAVVALVFIVGCFADVPDGPHKLPHPHQFVVNGTRAKPGTHPYMVALTVGSGEDIEYICGGSLITKRTILTAAHCVEDVYADGALEKGLGVTVGTNRWKEGGRTYLVEGNVTHPLYNPVTFENDIAVLFTKDEVELTEGVMTITIAYDYVPENVMTKVTGWGSDGKNSPEFLQEIELPTINGVKCVEESKKVAEERKTLYGTVDPDIEICTFTARGFGTCVGDSGSPLTRLSDHRQIGIVSWGFPCALGAPDVFTRLSAYDQWLNEHVIH